MIDSLPSIPPSFFLRRMVHLWQIPFKLLLWRNLKHDKKMLILKNNNLSLDDNEIKTLFVQENRWKNGIIMNAKNDFDIILNCNLDTWLNEVDDYGQIKCSNSELYFNYNSIYTSCEKHIHREEPEFIIYLMNKCWETHCCLCDQEEDPWYLPIDDDFIYKDSDAWPAPYDTDYEDFMDCHFCNVSNYEKCESYRLPVKERCIRNDDRSAIDVYRYFVDNFSLDDYIDNVDDMFECVDDYDSADNIFSVNYKPKSAASKIKKWSNPDVNELKQLYKDGISIDEISEKIGRTKASIRSKLYKLKNIDGE